MFAPIGVPGGGGIRPQLLAIDVAGTVGSKRRNTRRMGSKAQLGGALHKELLPPRHRFNVVLNSGVHNHGRELRGNGREAQLHRPQPARRRRQGGAAAPPGAHDEDVDHDQCEEPPQHIGAPRPAIAAIPASARPEQ